MPHLSPPTNLFFQPPSVSSTTFVNEIPQVGVANQTTFLPPIPPHQQPFFPPNVPHPIIPTHQQQQIITTPNRRYRPPSVIADNIGLVEGGRDCWTTAVTGFIIYILFKFINLKVGNRQQ
jgi:hypothetical protein